MASSKPSQNPSSSQSKVNVDGYVHEVSEVKIPQTGNRASRYFDFKYKKETKRVICFSPDKRDQLKENENSKTPVTLMNVSPQKRKYQLDQTEYKMNQYSNIVVKKNLAFPWKSLRTDLSNDSQTLKQIEDHKNPTAQVGDVVSVKAKLISKSEVEPVFFYKLNKTFNKSETVIADSTSAMRLTLWGEAIDKVEIGKSYQFTKLKVCYFNGKYLNGSQDSSIAVTEAITLSPDSDATAARLQPKKKEVQEIKGRILAIDVNKQHVCVNCKHRNDYNEDTPDDLIQCSSCKISMLKETIPLDVSAYIIIADENQENLGRFYCNKETLDGMFQSLTEVEGYNLETKSNNMSKKLIVQTLLLVKQISFEILMEDKKIKAMKRNK